MRCLCQHCVLYVQYNHKCHIVIFVSVTSDFIIKKRRRRDKGDS